MINIISSVILGFFAVKMISLRKYSKLNLWAGIFMFYIIAIDLVCTTSLGVANIWLTLAALLIKLIFIGYSLHKINHAKLMQKRLRRKQRRAIISKLDIHTPNMCLAREAV